MVIDSKVVVLFNHTIERCCDPLVKFWLFTEYLLHLHAYVSIIAF
jgi:hypothetical protein